MFHDVEVYPNMLRNWRKAVREGNGPVPQQEDFGSGQPTLADVYHVYEEMFERWLKEVNSHLDKMDELTEDLRKIDQRVASLEHDARQPRLAMEADVPADNKNHERTEGAATAVQAKHGDSCTAKRVQAGPTCSTNFGVKAEPSALPCRDDVLVENGAAAPKSYFSSLEIRTPTAAGGLLPTKKNSTATRTTFHYLPLWFYPSEEINLKT